MGTSTCVIKAGPERTGISECARPSKGGTPALGQASSTRSPVVQAAAKKASTWIDPPLSGPAWPLEGGSVLHLRKASAF